MVLIYELLILEEYNQDNGTSLSLNILNKYDCHKLG